MEELKIWGNRLKRRFAVHPTLLGDLDFIREHKGWRAIRQKQFQRIRVLPKFIF